MRILKAISILAAFTLSGLPAIACDIAIPPELRRAPKGSRPAAPAGWNLFDFTPKAMVDGKLLYRHVKHQGLPSGAAEQKLLQEHAGRAVTAMYGGRSPVVKIQKASTVQLDSIGVRIPVRQYEIAVNTAGDAGIAKYAGVIIRANPTRKDIAIVVTPIDPDSPGDDLERPLAFAKRLAAHPGMDCSAGDSP